MGPYPKGPLQELGKSLYLWGDLVKGIMAFPDPCEIGGYLRTYSIKDKE
jgi:hypothetical protein